MTEKQYNIHLEVAIVVKADSAKRAREISRFVRSQIKTAIANDCKHHLVKISFVRVVWTWLVRKVIVRRI